MNSSDGFSTPSTARRRSPKRGLALVFALDCKKVLTKSSLQSLNTKVNLLPSQFFSQVHCFWSACYKNANYLWTASLRSVESRRILQKPWSGFPIGLSPELNPILNAPPKGYCPSPPTPSISLGALMTDCKSLIVMWSPLTKNRVA